MWFILWLCLGLWYHVTTTGQLNDSLTRVKLTASATKADYERLVGELQAGLSSAQRASQQHWATVEEQRASLEGAADEAARLKETVESLEATIESQKNDMEKQLSKRKRELLEINASWNGHHRELKASCAKDAEDASERLKETEKTCNDFKSALDTCNRRSCPKCPACHRCIFF